MSDDLKAQFERLLVHGDIHGAGGAAKQWLQAAGKPPNEIGLEIARSVAGVYRQLIVDPVINFVEVAPQVLGPEPGGIVVKALGRLIKLTEDWERRVRGCHEERLARELRDFARERNFMAALANIEALCLGDGTEADMVRRASYVGNVLGTLANNARETEHLVTMVARDANRFGLTVPAVNDMKTARDQRLAQMMSAGLVNLENQWSNTLVSTQTEIKNQLPVKNRVEDPTEADLRDTGDVFRSILRAPIARGRPAMLTDATLLLVDFSPRELSAAAAQSNVEGRSYATLGPTAKKTVALAFMDIGKGEFFARLYTAWAQQEQDSRYLKFIVELMGAFRSEHFSPFLLSFWDSRKQLDIRPYLVDAFGNLATTTAADRLLGDLRERTRARSIDATHMREIARDLAALAKIIRSPRCTPELRKRIVGEVIEMTPADNHRIGMMVALDVVAAKPDDLTPQERQWGTRVLVHALWLTDTASDLQKGGERQESILGFRHRIAESLKVLGRLEPNVLLQTMEKLTMRFSPAYMAAAEVLEKVALPDSVPILERMLFNALNFDESKQLAHEKEAYWDATAQQRKHYDKDQIVAPLVFALGTIATPEALGALQHVHQQIQSGKVQIPGAETGRFLHKFLTGPVATAQAVAAQAQKPQEVDPAELAELIKTLKSSFFLTGAEKRRLKKIQAMTRLAQLTPESAIDPLLDVLADKDPLVASAAVTTLAEYALPNKSTTLRAAVLRLAAAAMEHKDPAMRLGASRVFREIGPNRPDVKERLMGLLKVTDSSDVRLAIADLVKTGSGTPNPEEQMKAAAQAAAAGEAPPTPAAPGMGKLDQKRAYVQARQAWIRGGKQGPEPQPPAE